MDEEILEAIDAEDTEKKEEVSEEEAVNYLVFKAGLNFYAIESKNIQEVLRNNEIFPVPFVPDYMKGVVNFYGKPCAVVDFSLFQDYAELNSKLFLVLKDENDIAFQVSEILDFHNSKNGTIQKIAGASEASSFNSTLSFMGNNGPVNAPILNLNGIISKIRMDLENA